MTAPILARDVAKYICTALEDRQIHLSLLPHIKWYFRKGCSVSPLTEGNQNSGHPQPITSGNW